MKQPAAIASRTDSPTSFVEWGAVLAGWFWQPPFVCAAHLRGSHWAFHHFPLGKLWPIGESHCDGGRVLGLGATDRLVNGRRLCRGTNAFTPAEAGDETEFRDGLHWRPGLGDCTTGQRVLKRSPPPVLAYEPVLRWRVLQPAPHLARQIRWITFSTQCSDRAQPTSSPLEPRLGLLSHAIKLRRLRMRSVANYPAS
jgi:hypothetical protein